MENFSSFDAAAALAARQEALLRAAASDSESGSSEGDEERGTESSSSSSSSDDDGDEKGDGDDQRGDQGRKAETARTGEQRGRRIAEKKKEKEKRKSKTKKKKEKNSTEKSRSKRKKKRRRRSRSKTPPPPRRETLVLPPPGPYAAPPLPFLPDPSTFSTVQNAVAAIDDAIIFGGGEEEEEEEREERDGERIVAAVRLLLASGHAEAAAARVAAAAEFHFLVPEGLRVAPHGARLESFERFWESGAALACEEGEEGQAGGGGNGGGGWRGWFDSGCLPPPPPKPKPSPSKSFISAEDAGLAAEIAAEVDARVARLLPEGCVRLSAERERKEKKRKRKRRRKTCTRPPLLILRSLTSPTPTKKNRDATIPASLASRWAREEELAASAAWRPLRGPAAVAALAAALPNDEVDGDAALSSAFAPFASVRSAGLRGNSASSMAASASSVAFLVCCGLFAMSVIASSLRRTELTARSAAHGAGRAATACAVRAGRNSCARIPARLAAIRDHAGSAPSSTKPPEFHPIALAMRKKPGQ